MFTSTVLWGKTGSAEFFCDNDWLYTLDGRPIAYIERDGAVFTTSGQHVAWLQGGVLRDKHGYCLAVGAQADDLMHPPLAGGTRMQVQPNMKYSYLCPPLTMLASPPPVPRYGWSGVNAREVLSN